MLHYLIEGIGIEQRDGEVTVQDGDLWSFIDAGSLFPFDGGEAAAQWAGAADTLHRLAELSQRRLLR